MRFKIIFIFILFSLAGCAPSANDKAPAGKTVSIHTEKIETACCIVSADHPGFRDDSPCADSVSSWISRTTQEFLSKASPENQQFKSELNITLSKQSTHGSMLSLKFDISEYMGGAHPNVYIETFVFNLKTGRRFYIKDIFKSPEKAFSILAAEAVKQLSSARDGELTEMEKGRLLPSEENFRYFGFEENALSLYFPVYQAGPRSAGQQKAEIPCSMIKSLLAPKTAETLGITKH